MPLRYLALLSALLFLMVGCGVAPHSLKTQHPPVSWEARQQQLQRLQQWQVEGRVALRMGSEGGQSGFVWRQSPQRQQFELSGLLGAGAIRLVSGGEGALLESAGEQHRGEHPSQLLQRVTGWQIPVEAAQYWIKGVPAPDATPQLLVLDGENRLQRLQQMGWKIEIRRYQTVGALELPGFVVLEQGEVRLKLKLTRWSLS
jgi:outer membrane lipoprotein LolB